LTGAAVITAVREVVLRPHGQRGQGDEEGVAVGGEGVVGAGWRPGSTVRVTRSTVVPLEPVGEHAVADAGGLARAPGRSRPRPWRGPR
jgi:hypothetical protein